MPASSSLAYCAQSRPQGQGYRQKIRVQSTSTPGRARAASEVQNQILTVEIAQQIAQARGLSLRVNTLGPAYEVVCRDGTDTGAIVGTSSGLVLSPLKLLHCDKMEIFTRRRGGSEGQRMRGGILGLGLLVAMTVFAHGYAAGCTTAEILAINDDDAWHQRLVRHYERMYGFQTVKEVTGKLTDLPDMLVWGGVGTRMNANIENTLRRWTPALQQDLQKRSQQ